MKFKIMPQAGAEKYFSTDRKEKYVIIALIDPYTEAHYQWAPLNHLDTKTIWINDIDDPKFAKEHKYKIMNENQANQIIDFVEEYKDIVDFFLVHCSAGVCRSPGCAAALSTIYNGNAREIFQYPLYIPNMHVYRTILKVAEKRGMFEGYGTD